MLTEADIFPNLGGLTAPQVKELTLQERARLRMSPCLLSPQDLISLRDGAVRSDPDEVERVVHGQW